MCLVNPIVGVVLRLSDKGQCYKTLSLSGYVDIILEGQHSPEDRIGYRLVLFTAKGLFMFIEM